jgi:hypothetical protein
MHVLELGLGLSAVEALHALSIVVACIQISITDATHEEQQTCECNSARSAMDRFVARIHLRGFQSPRHSYTLKQGT